MRRGANCGRSVGRREGGLAVGVEGKRRVGGLAVDVERDGRHGGPSYGRRG